MSFVWDPLTLFFIGAIAISCIPSLIFSVGYMHAASLRKKLLTHTLTFIFIASMIGVVSVNNVFAFLIAWEIMSLVSYFLVISDDKHTPALSAGTRYLVMTHIGTGFLVVGFLLLYRQAHSFDYIAIKYACTTMPHTLRTAVFICFLVGFGTKAGVVPLHIWLPAAHPQAPSHISSIMSGVMIKTAVYGFIRFVLFILGVDTEWWAVVVLCIAALSAVVGILYATIERDLKRLWAYSSIENIGIVLFGVGASMLFIVNNNKYLAVLALAAALFHSISHLVGKGLLFLCAGSIQHATGTRDTEKLGGLIRTMPWTAALFLVGAMTLTGLPPFGGFASKWLTLQSLFCGMLDGKTAVVLWLALSAAALLLASGITAACCVKAFGTTCLASPRTREAAYSHESPWSMRIGMILFALMTLALGIFAGTYVTYFAQVAAYCLGIDARQMLFALNALVVQPQYGSNILLSPLVILLIVTLFGLLAYVAYLFRKTQTTRIDIPWNCGYYISSVHNQYTPTAFAKPFMIAFSFFLRPRRKKHKEIAAHYHIMSFQYETDPTKVFKKYLYEPGFLIVLKTARMMKRMQAGSIHLYIGYIFIALVVTLLCVERW